MLDSKDKLWITIFAVMGVLIGAYYGGMMLVSTGGHPMAPLDDTFIHLQYAKNLSQGNFFSYNPGDGFSTGATSILYPLVLVPGFWIGLSGIKIIIYTFAIGVACIILTSITLYVFVKELVDSNIAGRIAALLFLSNGNVMWGYLSGMETGLFATLIVLCLASVTLWLRNPSGKSITFALICVSLLPLMRPEGIVIVLITVAVIALRYRYKRVESGEFFLWFIPLAPIVFYLLLNKLFSGTITTNGMLNKSVMYHPYMTFAEKIYNTTSNFTNILRGYYGNISFAGFKDKIPVPYFPPFVFFFFMLGSTVYAIREIREKKYATNTLGFFWFFGCISLVATLEQPFVHNMRYFQFYQPLFFIFVALGIYGFSQIFSQKSENVMRGVGAFLIILSLPSLGYWGAEYGENCGDIYNQHRRMSWYLKDATPEDSVIGVTDAGLLAYFGERRIHDLVGLTTNDMALWFRNGVGSAYERMERCEEDELPDYIVTYNYGYLWTPENFLGERIYQVSLDKNTITHGEALGVFKQDWQYLNAGEKMYRDHSARLGKPPEKVVVVDSVDVADLRCEKQHRYAITYDSEKPAPDWPPSQFNVFGDLEYENLDKGRRFRAAQQSITVWDGGRLTTGAERMSVQTSPKKPVLIVMRTDVWYPVKLKVSIDDRFVGEWDIKPDSDKRAWHEPDFLIPADFVKSNVSEVRIEYVWDHVFKSRHRSFYYWFLQ